MTVTAATSAADRRKALRDWFEALAKAMRRMREAFARDSAESDVKRFKMRKLRALLGNAATMYWALSDVDRVALRDDYFAAICALKLVQDDLVVEKYVVARRQAESGATIKTADRVDIPTIRELYRTTLELFIRSHPFIHDDPNKRGIPFYPIRTRNDERAAGFLASLSRIRLFQTGALVGVDNLVDLLRRKVQAIEADVAKITGTTANDFDLSRDSTHVIGAYFMLLQLFLNDLREPRGRIMSPKFPADDWYAAAAEAIGELRQRVLGLHAGLERKALAAGKPALALELKSAGKAAIKTLIDVYSIRLEQTAAVWSFRTRRVLKKKGEVFLQQRLLVGSNKVAETLMSYLGRGNPDSDAPEGMDVAFLLAQDSTPAGETVTVLGEFQAKGPMLRSLSTKDRVAVDAPSMDLIAAQQAGPVGVEVTGAFDKKLSLLVASEINWFAQDYQASIGFPAPLVGSPPKLALAPSWRRTTRALENDAIEDDKRDSIPRSLDGQQRLLLDLLAIPEVAKAIKKKLKKKVATPQSLHDHDVRGAVWHALLTVLHRDDPKTALEKLVEHIQRYLRHATRHTLWNVRDEDPPYFNTKWPETISGRTLYDCGVYTVLMALDLYRALKAIKGSRIRFGYVTILNHITLVAYTDSRSLFLNNDVLRGPAPMSADDNKNDTTRADFALTRWGPEVFVNVYHVLFSVALVRVPLEIVDSRLDEAKFKKQLWKSYKKFSKWWGLRPRMADAYHRGIIEFDRGMKAVKKLLDQTPVSAAIDSDAMVRLSADAKLLFELGDGLASKQNFGDRPEFKAKKVKERTTTAVVAPPDVEPPIYEIVRRVIAAKNAGKVLTADQTALLSRPTNLQDHANALLNVP